MTNLASIFLAVFSVSAVFVSGTNAQQYRPLAGGLSDIDVNHHTVQDLVKSLPTLTNQLHGFEIVQVVRAQVQVVSGINYVLTIKTRRQGSNGPASHECQVAVWIQSWLERKTLTSLKCHSLAALGVPGGWKEAQVTDQVRDAVKVGMKLFNQICNCLSKRVVTKIISVKQRVVAGMMYEIDIALGESTCLNSPETYGKGIDECPLKEGAMVQECKLVMIHQPWMHLKYRLFKHTCH